MGVTDCPGVQREAGCSISSISAVTVLQLTHVAQLQRKGTRRCGTSPSRVRRTTDCRISRLSRFALCTQLGSVEYLLRSALLSLPCAGTQSQYRRPAPSSDDTNRQRSRLLLWRSIKQHSDDKYYLSSKSWAVECFLIVEALWFLLGAILCWHQPTEKQIITLKIF